MKARGMGLIYQPTWKDQKTGETKTSTVWWIQYNVRGKRIRKRVQDPKRPDMGSRKRADAARLLKKRLTEAQRGKPVGPDVERTTLGDLATMLRNDYAVNGHGVESIKAPLAHLSKYFGETCRAINITSDRITTYVAERIETGAAQATINRSLSALKRAFRLAEIAKKVADRPHIAMLEENNARQGFVTRGEFARLHDALPADLRDPVDFLYYSAWRVGEMRSLEWRDIKDGVIRLRSENSKNKRGRELPLVRELAEIIERARERRIPECPFVFHRDDGSPIGLFRKSWATACKKSGLGKILVHDLRRSAIKNFIDAHVPEKTAMAISGHRTRSTFDRYQITTTEAVIKALEAASDHLAAQPQTPANVVPLKNSAHVQPMSGRQSAIVALKNSSKY